MDRITMVGDFFAALNDRDVTRAGLHFSAEGHRVKNAANPEVTGPTAIAETVAGLFERTLAVEFMVRSTAELGDAVIADWVATFVFAEGGELNGKRTRSFRVSLEGIDTFVFNKADQIVSCDIVHETATVARAAAAHVIHQETPVVVDPMVLVETYLRAEESEDRETLMEMFAENVVVRNAANPVDAMPGSAGRYLASFWERTSARSFSPHLAGFDGNGNVLASFTSVITFKAGVAFGSVVAAAEFTVELPTAMRFALDDRGKVTEVTVVHETTSAMAMAAGGAA